MPVRLPATTASPQTNSGWATVSSMAMPPPRLRAYDDKLATESYRSPLRRGVHSDEVSGDAGCMLMMLYFRSWVSLEVLCRRFR